MHEHSRPPVQAYCIDGSACPGGVRASEECLPAPLQAALAAKSDEAAQLLDMCNTLVSEAEAAHGSAKSGAAAEGARRA